MCAEEDRYIQFMAARATPPPLTSGDTLHWDGRGAIAPGMELTQGAEPGACAVLPVHGQLATGCRALPCVPTRPLGLLPSLPVPAIAWARAAASLTFYLDPRLLLAPVHAVLPGVTGTLLWVHGQGDEESITPAVHPALLVQTASASRQGAYVELVPHVPLDDPLHRHIASVLQAAVAAEGMADRLYAEALANALADHLLRRYAACRQPERVCSGGLTPSRLQRTTAYIQAHLEQALSLVELAAVAQMSPSHFAHLFKQATGQTSHQYVTTCRMECAKHLLTETTLLLHEVGARVGYADQSHFTAMFRQHVGTTPKAYRDATTRS
jgi:AraC-like DNA-binding protein